jgi:putative two-component system response regulator
VFGDWLGLEAEDVLALRRGGVLHDIGKLAIPDAILMKPGPLDGTEWEIMKMHPEMGAELIGPLMSMRRTLPVIRNHHERWDGSGYPDGLHGKDIPKLARIFQVTDVFDALSSRRSYKPSLPREAVVDQLRLESARGLLDPDVVEEVLGLLAAAPTKFLPAAAAPQSELGPRMFRLTYRPGE